MYQVFYFLAVAALVGVLYGATQSKNEIAAYAIAASLVLYFLGAVLHHLSDILNELKKLGGADEPNTEQEPDAADVKPSEDK